MRWVIMIGVLVALGSCGQQTPWPLFVENETSKETSGSPISHLRFHTSRSSAGLISPLFPENTATVVCSFQVRGLRSGTRIAVRWQRSGRVLATNNLVVSENTRTMSADLASNAPLGSGTYEVAVLRGGRVEVSGTFRIAGEPEAPRQSNQGPRVFDLTLVSGNAECIPESSSRSNQVTTFTGGVGSVSICLQYENIRRGQRLEVRWFRGSGTGQPLSVTNYSPEGDGELSASYAHDDGIEPGTYTVTVTLAGREQGRARFQVRP
jgi:hypothetical protein